MRTLSARMRTKSVGKLSPHPLQPSTFRYAALHSWIAAQIAAEDNLKLSELLHRDTEPPAAPLATGPPATPAATTTAATTVTATTTAATNRASTSRSSYASDREPREP